MYAQDSIDLLKASGIDFDRFEREGIDVCYFGELMMMSGLVLNDEVRWMTFHSSFDFGYLLKALTNADLPSEESVFMDLLVTFFPCIYDVKVIRLLQTAKLLNLSPLVHDDGCRGLLWRSECPGGHSSS